MSQSRSLPLIALACGGTGGHLFPGLAVADVLQQWGCEVALLVSKKEVDQEAVKSALGMRVLALPAVALQNRKWSSFLRGSWQSYRTCRKSFEQLRPRAVLAMGGFTSAPPVLAGKRKGLATFLHESNSVPGRANRWLSPWVDEVFVGFPTAARRLYNQSIRTVGTPVRSQFTPSDPGAARMALGLDPNKPVLLVMGGSQGAAGINRLMQGAISILAARVPELQYLHLAGGEDGPKLQAAYAAQSARAVVRPFLTEMDLALGAATLAVNRAGASSLAELAAMRVPALLIPYPHATDNHQYHNARALVDSGAARLLDQASASSEDLATAVLDLFTDASARAAMQRALQQWHFPNAAEEIAGHMFTRLGLPRPEPASGMASFRLPETAGAAPKLWKGGTFKLAAATIKSQS
jgi:UDP-N-acetylglucosamine--N-acetylmuramyl-(pentapeptide) pyrophosphoryl-undecaprenol N-acetylglucosamine transferase